MIIYDGAFFEKFNGQGTYTFADGEVYTGSSPTINGKVRE